MTGSNELYFNFLLREVTFSATKNSGSKKFSTSQAYVYKPPNSPSIFLFFPTRLKSLQGNPKRSPLQYSRAAWNTGIFPYVMPKQWGVGAGHEGCGNEIILHVGHIGVQDYYLKERL